LLACLYGLYALLRLHFLQEEENYFTLTDDEPSKPPHTGATRHTGNALDSGHRQCLRRRRCPVN
jgi:hypothetical protein